MANVATLLGSVDHALLLNSITKAEDGFVATIVGVRIKLSVDTDMRMAMVQSVEQLPREL
ncbi:hypothetical protein [Myxococcus qinghaiensis]|uniref:hypothetical protein n=1 Tax=Myxococcus qinghaiensis TaxID=2906758 RepID=UPI0020A81B63|nr:hypothetical protein [Myxococcus qinghaiensis]MCP3163329.1 hypothetical protein [Myxococcus qinghaiensis]